MGSELRVSEKRICNWCGCAMWIKEAEDGGSILMREHRVGLTCVRCEFIEAGLTLWDHYSSGNKGDGAL